MQFTGPVKKWRMWIDIESREPMDRDDSHADFTIADLAGAITAVTREIEGDSRMVVKSVMITEEEDDY